jgi:hypothetical protein
MPACTEYKTADLVNTNYRLVIFYSFYTVVLQNASVVVSGGKTIKACGRSYFLAESSVRTFNLNSNCCDNLVDDKNYTQNYIVDFFKIKKYDISV